MVVAAATAAAATQAAWRAVPGSIRLLGTGFPASPCRPAHFSLLLLAAPHSHVLGASYPSVRINNCTSRVQTGFWRQSDMQIWAGPREGPFIPSQIGGRGSASRVAPSRAPLPQSRQIILTARTLPVSHWPSGWVHIHLQIMLCDSPGC